MTEFRFNYTHEEVWSLTHNLLYIHYPINARYAVHQHFDLSSRITLHNNNFLTFKNFSIEDRSYFLKRSLKVLNQMWLSHPIHFYGQIKESGGASFSSIYGNVYCLGSHILTQGKTPSVLELTRSIAESKKFINNEDRAVLYTGKRKS